jgi:hypothetical protein
MTPGHRNRGTLRSPDPLHNVFAKMKGDGTGCL